MAIMERVDAIHKELENLSVSISDLENTLAPAVLVGPQPPTTAENAVQEDLSPLENQLMIAGRKIANATQKIQELNSSIHL